MEKHAQGDPDNRSCKRPLCKLRAVIKAHTQKKNNRTLTTEEIRSNTLELDNSLGAEFKN